ncbi:hypothetical protein [Lignipirellula cremea]|uniref:Uncharacterized protein n=1 Tax=Lignipirellula cremea TaxID=2528010 RepID=A0A518E3D3_9BACT|nr:hypothetical protein [Lignipirellula cremea]QDU98601.1 hypothetical protein Pla8534_64720 [Lignipirellula cremea]
MAIGILAYGSLIRDPGSEIKPAIANRITCITPFKVEFARLSQKRGNAPTLVPVKAGGSHVRAVVLVLNVKVTEQEAKTLLWHREIGKYNNQAYAEPHDPERSPKKVLIRTLQNFESVERVLYTDFPESGKLPKPDGKLLAEAALISAQKQSVTKGMDGISYLIAAISAGIETALLPSYKREILALTGAETLKEALANLRNTLTAEELDEARRRAYGFSLERGDGKLPPYNPNDATGDFWRAAGEVVAQRENKATQLFTLELLQAINDWQCGGNAKEKNERGKKLQDVAAGLPEKFRQTDVACYRRLKLHKSAVWTLGTDEELAETISAWTESEAVAMGFKGGVPEPGSQGVIFKINPGLGSVVLNLSRLYKDEGFQKAISEHKGKIAGFDLGIGKYENTQEEVVIENGSVQLDSMHAWGGFSSSEEELATQFFERKPTKEDMDAFRKIMEERGRKAGPKWLKTPDAVKRISAKLVTHTERLAKLKK